MWEIRQLDGNVTKIISESNPCIARIVHPFDDDEAQANARLIAAAPDMFEALQEVVDYWRSEDPLMYSSPIATAAIEAIRKAKGK